MTPAEALARIAALCDSATADGWNRLQLVTLVRAVLAEVTPEPGGTLDRDQARAVLMAFWEHACGPLSLHPDDYLDRLARCVRPATIDRDALLELFRPYRDAYLGEGEASLAGWLTDQILALVRPVAGVTLAGDERIEALEALKPVLGRLEGEAHWRAPAVRALVERLEATR